MLGLEITAAGRMKDGAYETLLPILSADLAKYPDDIVACAIQQHRENSPFWPALSDLMKFIQPKMDWLNKINRRQQQLEEQFARREEFDSEATQ